MRRAFTLLTAFATLTLVACLPPPKPDATTQRVQFELTMRTAGHAANHRAGASGRATHGADRSARVGIDDGRSNQLWPGTDGDVVEKQVGTVVQLLSGSAVNDQWNVGNASELAAAEWLFLKVVKVDAVPATGNESGLRRFSDTPVTASSLSSAGTWFRVRFFGADRPDVGHVQGYLNLDASGTPRWYRVQNLPRKLLGPQSRDYRDGDIFEFRRVTQVDGSVGKLYPLK